MVWVAPLVPLIKGSYSPRKNQLSGSLRNMPPPLGNQNPPFVGQSIQLEQPQGENKSLGLKLQGPGRKNGLAVGKHAPREGLGRSKFVLALLINQ